MSDTRDATREAIQQRRVMGWPSPQGSHASRSRCSEGSTYQIAKVTVASAAAISESRSRNESRRRFALRLKMTHRSAESRESSHERVHVRPRI
jgi:hypothetical protein